MSKTYLENFFVEKNLDDQIYEIPAPDGNLHLISSDFVIESILIAPASEQKQIAATLRKIDFMNGDVHHFLRYLAGALAVNFGTPFA